MGLQRIHPSIRWTLLPLVLVTVFVLGSCRTERIEGQEPGDCADGADNDSDGSFDCNDPGCAAAPACEESGDDDSGGDDDTGDDDTGDDDSNSHDDDAGDDDSESHDDDAGDDDSESHDDDTGDDDSESHDDDTGGHDDDDSGDEPPECCLDNSCPNPEECIPECCEDNSCADLKDCIPLEDGDDDSAGECAPLPAPHGHNEEGMGANCTGYTQALCAECYDGVDNDTDGGADCQDPEAIVNLALENCRNVRSCDGDPTTDCP